MGGLNLLGLNTTCLKGFITLLHYIAIISPKHNERSCKADLNSRQFSVLSLFEWSQWKKKSNFFSYNAVSIWLTV